MLLARSLRGLFSLDSSYMWVYILMIAAVAIAAYSQFKVQGTYQKYKQIPAETQLTGAEVARKILEHNGITDVQVVPGTGAELSDFYDPKNKTVSLSSNIYNTNSIAAVSVAAHEVGHAIQHATNYSFIAVRNSILPMAVVASRFSMIVLMVGAMLIGSMGPTVLWIGIALYAVVGLFQFVTLPVEFDASKRALANLTSMGIIGGEDLQDSKKMLNAAAFTYVAAFLSTILNIIRFVLIALSGSNRRRN